MVVVLICGVRLDLPQARLSRLPRQEAFAKLFEQPQGIRAAMGNRLMVGRLTLNQLIGVRIPVPQPTRENPRFYEGFRCARG